MAPKSTYITGYRANLGTDHKTIKRNERERNRVQNLNSSFEVLRQNIPGAAPMKKISKIQILHQAVNYIQYLHQLIETTRQNVKTEVVSPGGQQYDCYPGYYQGYQSPTTPLSPPLSYESDTSGVFSDYSMQSPHTQDWSAHHQYHYHHTGQEVTSTTSPTDQLSEDEEDERQSDTGDHRWPSHILSQPLT